MRTTIDAAGRLVIPKEIRRQAGLQPGMPVDVRFQDGRIEVEPAALPVKLVREGRLLVAVPETETPPLKSEDVGATLDVLRHQRDGGA